MIDVGCSMDSNQTEVVSAGVETLKFSVRRWVRSRCFGGRKR